MLLVEDSADYERGIPLAAAALITGASKSTVCMWALRGKVRIVGRTDRGHALYHYGDLVSADAATIASPYSSRNPARASASA